jgi:hypothetical protein
MPEPCESCKHYDAAPSLPEPLCHKGVRYGRALVSAVSVRTMRDDHWWGRDGCQQEGRFWEARK